MFAGPEQIAVPPEYSLDEQDSALPPESYEASQLAYPALAQAEFPDSESP